LRNKGNNGLNSASVNAQNGGIAPPFCMPIGQVDEKLIASHSRVQDAVVNARHEIFSRCMLVMRNGIETVTGHLQYKT
jgi:hypothetical protein